jgi:rRNA processing protein Gar1
MTAKHSFNVGDIVRVIDQNISGVVLEVHGPYQDSYIVIEDDDSEWEYPESRLEFRARELESIPVK